MLWESVDPGQALTQRFGFGRASDVAGWLGEELSRHWGLSLEECERVVISAGNALAWIRAGERRLLAKWSVLTWLFPRLGQIAALTAWLDAQGLPVAAPLPAADGRLQVDLGRFSLGLQEVVEADLLDVGDPAQVTAAGRTLAEVHELMGAYPGRIESAPGPDGAALIHNDYRAANILQRGGRIAALLDFEEVCYDARMADLAKSAVLLGTRYRDWEPTSVQVREAFVAAYHERLPLAATERAELGERVTAWLQKKGWT
jgi:homoserine kinase type II